MQQTFFGLGEASMREAITSGADIAKLLTEQSATLTHPTMYPMFGGSVSTLLRTFAVLRDAGFVEKTGHAEIDAFMQSGPNMMAAHLTQSIATRDKSVGDKLSALCFVVSKHRDKISFNAQVEPEPPAPVPAKPEPLEVRIVQMPTRETITDVIRNKGDEITNTVQTTSDRVM